MPTSPEGQRLKLDARRSSLIELVQPFVNLVDSLTQGLERWAEFPATSSVPSSVSPSAFHAHFPSPRGVFTGR
jgi:hypothetical protein